MQIGYCGNVHPGRTIEEVKKNLIEHTISVKQQVQPDEPMGFGLWLSQTAQTELLQRDEVERFRDWLQESGLLPFTFNGFPYGDFHQEVVKHSVYLPTWADRNRLEYTIRLAEIQNRLLPDGIDGTISTLPLGWPVTTELASDRSFFEACANNLRECANRLNQIETESGRNIFICIEPEPGCLLDTCEDITGFFEDHLLTGTSQHNDTVLQHIGVCHDICHSAVMFEDQSTAIESYRAANIRVGKVQVSSAIAVNFDGQSPTEKRQMLEQLASFAEPRYLHQTSIRNDKKTIFYEDLPQALESNSLDPTGQWRVHFHVPIFSDQLDLISTTQAEIKKCLNAICKDDKTQHFEIETYAWNVLPDRLRNGSLADGIAREIEWFRTMV